MPLEKVKESLVSCMKFWGVWFLIFIGAFMIFVTFSHWQQNGMQKETLAETKRLSEYRGILDDMKNTLTHLEDHHKFYKQDRDLWLENFKKIEERLDKIEKRK